MPFNKPECIHPERCAINNTPIARLHAVLCCHSLVPQHTNLSHASQLHKCSLPDVRLERAYFPNVVQSNVYINRYFAVNICAAGREGKRIRDYFVHAAVTITIFSICGPW